ncbi:MAG: XylR family transcriptional regulator [Phycisphaerales bacterium]|nr:XylR family transcriptional regulator [Phycisphaerales bacterium]
MRRPTRNILLLYDTRSHIARQVLRGIYSYASQKTAWHWRASDPEPDFIKYLGPWRPDGIIATIGDEMIANTIRRLGIPAVDTANCLKDPPAAQVGVDDQRVGADAAEYFMERGFKRFAYLGLCNGWFSEGRQRGFVSRLKREGFDCRCILTTDQAKTVEQSPIWAGGNEEVIRELRQLPRPTGLFASHDQLGLAAALQCHDARIAVPESISILAVDNDETLCTLSQPPLSSIVQPAERIGVEAARTLDHILRGYTRPAPQFFPPGEAVTRRSSDIRAIRDQDVLDAIAFINKNVPRGLSVADVVDEVLISRRRLEQKFIKALGYGPHEQIRRSQVLQARRLLATTELPTPVVANNCGIPNAQRLSLIFRSYTGCTPLEYRRLFSI